MFMHIFRGTAFSQQTSLNWTPSVDNSVTNYRYDDSKLGSNDGSQNSRLCDIETNNELRRPRVYFADVNRVQFFDDTTDSSLDSSAMAMQHRRSLHVLSNKSTSPPARKPISSTKLQHAQTFCISSAHQVKQHRQDSTIHKQTSISSSNTKPLPVIANSMREKYTLQRDKPFLRFPEPACEQLMNSSTDISRDSTRASDVQSLATRLSINESSASYDTDGTAHGLLSSMPISSQQRLPRRTISLRQQFVSPRKSKATDSNHSSQVHRSRSMKPMTARMPSTNDDNLCLPEQHELIFTEDSQSTMGSNSFQRTNRNYINHFDMKTSLNRYGTVESQRTPDHYRSKSIYTKATSDDTANSSRMYLSTGLINTPQDSAMYQINRQAPIDRHVRLLGDTGGARQMYEYQIASNTIIV
jgi:hypothetical protein